MASDSVWEFCFQELGKILVAFRVHESDVQTCFELTKVLGIWSQALTDFLISSPVFSNFSLWLFFLMWCGNAMLWLPFSSRGTCQNHSRISKEAIKTVGQGSSLRKKKTYGQWCAPCARGIFRSVRVAVYFKGGGLCWKFRDVQLIITFWKFNNLSFT